MLCAAILRTIDRIYAAEGPDEPDLGLNVTWVTTRRSLARLATAEAWEPPASTADAICSRLRSLESIDDPVRLETELLSLPMWTLRMLDRRRAGRPVAAGPMPRRRAGDQRNVSAQAGTSP
ncbi:MAG TPA: hypothetical protein VK987_06030 [Anaerolineae bacterium]|nr:hypothetical protein [Anaerolineae bacterium]